MRLYIMVEPNFKNTSSCGAIYKGLKQALSKKRMKHTLVSSIGEIGYSEEQTFLIIVSTNIAFISNSVAVCDRMNFHPIILTPQLLHSLPGVYSDVTSDIRHSMRYLMSYLKKNGKERPALYGISDKSLPDVARRDRFLEKHILPTSAEDVYYNKTTLDDCFNLFKKKIDRYDSVICPNDYVAIHLVKSLKKINYPIKNIKIISHGQLLISARYHREIVSLSVGYENFGKAAITICEQLQNNPDLLYMSLSVKSRINPDVETQVEPIELNNAIDLENEGDAFYKDPDIKNMILIEKLLNSSDKIDLTILDMVLNGSSYEDISSACFLSMSATKYRVRRMVQSCNCYSKLQLTELIKKYI